MLLKKNEIEKFIHGEGEYFIIDREYGEHWFLGSWLYHILPALEIDKNSAKFVLQIFEILISKYPNDISSMECLLNHIFIYSYILKEGRISENLIYSLDVDIQKKITEYQEFLIFNKLEKEYQEFKQTVALIKRNEYLLDFQFV